MTRITERVAAHPGLAAAPRICSLTLSTALLCAAPGRVLGGDWSLNLGQWSWHRGDADNAIHHLVAVEYRGWMLGGMINSHDRASLIAGYHFRKPLTDWFTAGLRVGAATSYDNGLGDTGIRPAAVLSAFFHRKGVGVEVNLAPSGVISAGFRWDI